MKSVIALLAVVACASGSSLLGAAPLIPRVQVAPTQVNVVKQPITIQQPVSVPRSVPYPVRAVAYTAPEIHSPVIQAAPALAAYAAPAYAPAYASGLAYGAPAYAPGLAYGASAYGPGLAYAGPGLAYSAPAIAAPGLLARSHLALAH